MSPQNHVLTAKTNETTCVSKTHYTLLVIRGERERERERLIKREREKQYFRGYRD